MSNRQNKPTVGGLSFILRHKELWPQGFVWDYARCESCAMGLAHEIWQDHIPAPSVECMINALGIPLNQAEDVFIRAPSVLAKSAEFSGSRYSIKKTTPEEVADLLDAVA